MEKCNKKMIYKPTKCETSAPYFSSKMTGYQPSQGSPVAKRIR